MNWVRVEDLKKGGMAVVLLVAVFAHAADFTWLNTPASGNWNAADTNWSGAGSVWVNAPTNNAVFGTSGTQSIAVDAVTVQNLAFAADGYSLSGGSFDMYGTVTVGVSQVATVLTPISYTNTTKILSKYGNGTLVLNPVGAGVSNRITSFRPEAGTVLITGGTNVVTLSNSDPESGPALWVKGGTLMMAGGLLKTVAAIPKYARVSDGGTLLVTNGLVDLSANDELLNAHNTAGTVTVSGSGVLDVLALRISQQYGAASLAVVNVNTGGVIKLNNFNLDASSKKYGTVNFNGGTLFCKADGADLLNTGNTNWSGIVSYVLPGGAIIDSNGKSVTIRQNLLSGAANDGGLTKKNSGNLNLRGTNTYVGGTFLLGGSLNIINDNNLGAVPASPATNFTFVGSSTLFSGANNTLAANRTLRIPHAVIATFDTQSYTQTVNGVIAGEGTTNSIVKLNTGALILDPGAARGVTVRSFTISGGAVQMLSGTNQITAASGSVQGTLGLFVNNASLLVGGGLLKTTGSGYVTTTGGSLIITNGVVDFNSLSELLNAYSGAGNVTVSGSGLLDLGTLRISQAGGSPDSNVVNVNTGGVIRMHRFYMDEKTQSKGRVNFNGGTVVAKSTRTDFMGIANTNWFSGIYFTVREGGAVIDCNGFDIDSRQPIYSGAANDGGFTKKGAGTFTLFNTNTYNGVTTILGGTLKLSVTNTLLVSGSVLVASNALFDVTNQVQTLAVLGGSGTVTNNSLLTVTAAVMPGGTNSIGTLTLATTPASLAGSFAVDVATNGVCDRLVVRGNLNLSGLSLSVADTTLLNKKLPYTIATYTGTQSGAFVSNNLPLRWNVKYDAAGHRVYLIYNPGTLITVQ